MKHFHVFTWLLYAIGFAHAATIIQGTKGSGLHYARNASSSSLLHSKKTPFGIQPQSLFARQEECPPGFPELCPDDLCCEANTVCCDDATCCPNATPVCQSDGCCPTGDITCGSVAEGYCHPPDTTCCEGTDTYCPEADTCCGENCCISANGATCCASEDNGDVCCGEYQVCCDGWCCSEGATCGSEFDTCIVPDIIFGYGPNVSDIVENMCLGIRSQLNAGAPDTTAQTQILEYAGPGNGGRDNGPCGPGSCCSGQTNSQGDALQCDEYPFANSVESSPSAWAACVSEFSNGAQGDLLASFLSGRHAGFLYEVVITGIDCTAVPTNANPGLNANCL